MQGNKAGLLTKIVVQYGDVGKTDQGLWLVTHLCKIDHLCHAQAAITTPQGQKGCDLSVGPHPVKLVGPVDVGVGQIAGPRPEFTGKPGFKAHLGKQSDAGVKPLLITDLTGRGDNADDGPSFERGGDVLFQYLLVAWEWRKRRPFKVSMGSTSLMDWA